MIFKPSLLQILLPALLPAPSKHRARKCLSPCPHSFINRQLRQRPWVTYVLGLILLYAALLLTPQPLHAQTDSVAGRVNKSGPSATDAAIVEAQLTNTQTITSEETVASEAVITLGITDDPIDQRLGTLFTMLLREQGPDVVLKRYPDAETLLTALDQAEIDMGLALPVDALVLHYRLPLNALPTDTERMVQLADSMANKHGSHWLAPMLLPQNYALFAVVPADQTDPNSASAPLTLPQLADQLQRTGRTLTVCTEDSHHGLWLHTQQALLESYRLSPEQLGNVDLANPDAAEALTGNRCDLFFGFANLALPTESELSLSALTDPDHFFPPNHPSLIAQHVLLERHPAIAEAWTALVNTMDETTFATYQARMAEADSAADEERSAVPLNTPGDAVNLESEHMAIAYRFLLDLALVQRPTVTVGAQDETAQEILGTIAVELLKDAGYPVVDRVGTLAMVDALDDIEEERVTVAVALLGDALTIHNALPLDNLPADPLAARALLIERDEDHNFSILQPLDFSLTRVLLVDKDLAGLGITTLSRLTAYMNRFDAPFTICVDSDFYSRPVIGLNALEDFYGFGFDPAKILLMDEDTIFTAIQERQCQVTVGTITDGRIAAWNLLPLTDDRGFFPLNNPVTVVNQTLMRRQPEVAALLESYIPFLDTATMQQLTTRVELGADGVAASGDEENAQQVAVTFLREHNLLSQAQTGNTASGVVAVDQLSEEELGAFEELPGLPTTTRNDD